MPLYGRLEDNIEIFFTDIGPKKQKLIIDTDTDSDNPENVPEIKEKPKATVRGRTRRTDIDKEEVVSLLIFCVYANITCTGLIFIYIYFIEVKNILKFQY